MFEYKLKQYICFDRILFKNIHTEHNIALLMFQRNDRNRIVRQYHNITKL